MYIVASFEYSVSVELALKDIQNKGIEKKNILCATLDKRVNTEKFYDTIHRTDGRNTMGIPFFLATCCSLFGGVFGFLWEWGPIIWAGLGFLVGLSLGFIGIFILFKLQNKTKRRDNRSEVIVLIKCETSQENDVKKVLWEQYALGVSSINL